MKLQELIQELKEKNTYREFKKKYPNSYFSAGFFIFSSNEKEGDKLQLDFFIPTENKIASFEYPFVSYKIHEDKIEKAEEIKDLNLKMDVTNLKEVTERVLGQKFTKIIAILQERIWNITALSGITIKRMKINAYTENIIEAGDLALNDVMRVGKK